MSNRAILCAAGVLAVPAEATFHWIIAASYYGHGSTVSEFGLTGPADMLFLLWYLPAGAIANACGLRGISGTLIFLLGGTLQFFIIFAFAGWALRLILMKRVR